MKKLFYLQYIILAFKCLGYIPELPWIWVLSPAVVSLVYCISEGIKNDLTVKKRDELIRQLLEQQKRYQETREWKHRQLEKLKEENAQLKNRLKLP